MACLFQYDYGLALLTSCPTGSRTDGLLAAVENLCVQLFFQLLNHGAQGGLCDPAIFSGFGEMAELIDSKYVFQLL